jgi:hypothetical protein
MILFMKGAIIKPLMAFVIVNNSPPCQWHNYYAYKMWVANQQDHSAVTILNQDFSLHQSSMEFL